MTVGKTLSNIYSSVLKNKTAMIHVSSTQKCYTRMQPIVQFATHSAIRGDVYELCLKTSMDEMTLVQVGHAIRNLFVVREARFHVFGLSHEVQ